MAYFDHLFFSDILTRERDENEKLNVRRKPDPTLILFEPFCTTKSTTFQSFDMSKCSVTAKNAMFIYAYNYLFSKEEKQKYELYLSEICAYNKLQNPYIMKRFLDILVSKGNFVDWEEISGTLYGRTTFLSFLYGQMRNNEDLYVMGPLFQREKFVEEEYCVNSTYNSERAHTDTGVQYVYARSLIQRLCDTERTNFEQEPQIQLCKSNVNYANSLTRTSYQTPLNSRICSINLLFSFSFLPTVPKSFDGLCRHVPDYNFYLPKKQFRSDAKIDALLIKLRGNASLEKIKLLSRAKELYQVLFKMFKRKMIIDMILSRVILMENIYSWFLLYDSSPFYFKEIVCTSNCSFHWPIMVPLNKTGIGGGYESDTIELKFERKAVDYSNGLVTISTDNIAVASEFSCPSDLGDREEFFLETVKIEPFNVENRNRGFTVFRFNNMNLLSACFMIHFDNCALIMDAITNIDICDGDKTIVSASLDEIMQISSATGKWCILSLRPRSTAQNSLLYQVQKNLFLNPLTRFSEPITKLKLYWSQTFDNTDVGIQELTTFYVREQNTIQRSTLQIGRFFL